MYTDTSNNFEPGNGFKHSSEQSSPNDWANEKADNLENKLYGAPNVSSQQLKIEAKTALKELKAKAPHITFPVRMRLEQVLDKIEELNEF